MGKNFGVTMRKEPAMGSQATRKSVLQIRHLLLLAFLVPGAMPFAIRPPPSLAPWAGSLLSSPRSRAMAGIIPGPLRPRRGDSLGNDGGVGRASMVLDPSAAMEGGNMLAAALDAGTLAASGMGFPVGFVLGLLGGGGSILALPIFLYVLNEPTQSAIAESLVVVSIGAGVGFAAKVKSGVDLQIAIPFAGMAMTGSYLTAKFATSVPEVVRLGMFAIFALTSSISMWESAQDKPKQLEVAATGAGAGAVTGAGAVSGEGEAQENAPKGFSPQLGAQALGVGALTSMIGAGGGFVIMPALTLVGGIPVKKAVSSSLLIICLNSASAFLSYIDEVPLHWDVVLPFAGAVAAGAVVGSSFSQQVSQNMVKKLFSGTVLALCAVLLAWKLPAAISHLH